MTSNLWGGGCPLSKSVKLQKNRLNRKKIQKSVIWKKGSQFLFRNMSEHLTKVETREALSFDFEEETFLEEKISISKYHSANYNFDRQYSDCKPSFTNPDLIECVRVHKIRPINGLIEASFHT